MYYSLLNIGRKQGHTAAAVNTVYLSRRDLWGVEATLVCRTEEEAEEFSGEYGISTVCVEKLRSEATVAKLTGPVIFDTDAVIEIIRSMKTDTNERDDALDVMHIRVEQLMDRLMGEGVDHE